MAEQTLGNFYLSCDTIHREIFSVMIHEWQEAGLTWEWSDRAIVLGNHSVIKDRFLGMFSLQPGEGIYPARITLDTDFWRELIGQEETDAFLRDLRSIHGLQCRQQDNLFSIIDPGHQSGPIQQQLRDQIRGFGLRLPELVAS